MSAPDVNKLCPWCGESYPASPLIMRGEAEPARLITVPGICERCRFTMLGGLAEIPTAEKPITKFCVHGRPIVTGPEGWCDACEGEV